MARPKTPSPRPAAEPSLKETVQQLTEQVKELASQVEVLRNAIDEIREEFEYAIQNDKVGSRVRDEWRPVMHVTSLPKDPLATDFGERINAGTPDDLAPAPAPSPPGKAPEQGNLF